MNAQPQVDPLRTVRDITPRTNELGKRWAESISRKEWVAGTANPGDSLLLELLGEAVTASYLTDRQGAVWALGTMDLPFVVHTFYENCGHCERYVRPVNTVATAYADELITFVLMPTPADPAGKALAARFNDDVVVIYDDNFRDPTSYPDDPRLLGLIGYPVTHYLTSDRRIIGLNQGGKQAFVHPRKGTEEVLRKQENDTGKRLRAGIRKLLLFER